MAGLDNLVSSLKGLAALNKGGETCGIMEADLNDPKGLDYERQKKISSLTNGELSNTNTRETRSWGRGSKTNHSQSSNFPSREVLREGGEGGSQVGGRCRRAYSSWLSNTNGQHRVPGAIGQDSYYPRKTYYKDLIKSLKSIGRGHGEVALTGNLDQGARSRARGGWQKDKVISIDPHTKLLDEVRMSPREVRDMIRGNCSLIKTVSKDLIPGIERRIKRLYEHTNTTRETLARYLEGVCDLEPWQADRIINDQMNKYDAKAAIERMKRNGVKLVRWCAGECENHRPTHINKWPRGLNGCVFDINHPPIDPATGEPTMPGEQINCHCHLEVVK